MKDTVESHKKPDPPIASTEQARIYTYKGEELLPPDKTTEYIRDYPENSREYKIGLENLELYFRKLRPVLRKILGYDNADDKIQDVLITTILEIKAKNVRNPSSLIQFILGVARIATLGRINTKERHHRLYDKLLGHTLRLANNTETPEDILLAKERKDIARKLLDKLNQRDREIITRFYLSDQTKEQICEEMGLTETQFRLFKTRANQKLTELGKLHLSNGS